jgi:hypothetical protein
LFDAVLTLFDAVLTLFDDVPMFCCFVVV